MANTLKFVTVLVSVVALTLANSSLTHRRGYHDQSIKRYTNERTCWWNEICKEEFQMEFRCRCPRWSFCRSPGKYYNAYCSVMSSGYIWMQPRFSGGHYKYGRK
ncbi:uncharacterized protein [Panulirus ornatus]|uniref:uncharacterized protein n=1 Tax=Panulirus ornatus TaxID=150431 RepID=UPI003A847C84